MRAGMRSSLSELACLILLAGCGPKPARLTSETFAQPEQPASQPAAIQASVEPVVIRGLSIDAAMAELVKRLGESCPDGKRDDYPLAMSSWINAEDKRTALENHLEDRLVEAMKEADFTLVPRTDEAEQYIRMVQESRAGEASLKDRMDFGELRSARILLGGRTVHMSSHVEVSIRASDVETGALLLQRRVDVSWDDDLRSLSRTPLVSMADFWNGRVPSGGGGQAGNFAVEAEPLRLSYRLLPFVPGPGTNMVSRSEPLHDGGTLRSGDGFAIEFETNRSCYVYGFLLSSDGSASVIFPHKEIAVANRLEGGRPYRIPESPCYKLDDHPGTETIYLVASDEPLNDLDGLAHLLKQGHKSEGDLSRRIVEKMQAAESGKMLTHAYLDRPGSKGIQPHLANVEPGSDAAQTAGGEGPTDRFEALGCAVKTILINHR